LFAVLGHKLLADATGEIAKTAANASRATENFSTFFIFWGPLWNNRRFAGMSLEFRQRDKEASPFERRLP
jgi:hypothetical protein